MRITALVENTTSSDLKTKHGLSLYIQTANHQILFDVGPDCTLFDNAQKRDIDLTAIDTVIISHGHHDHGGALNRFLTINTTAKIYLQKKALEPHYNRTFFIKTAVGLDPALANHPQVILLDGDKQIDETLTLLTVPTGNKCPSPTNKALYDRYGQDNFAHEQNLLISENHITALIIGCGHRGIVNIMDKAHAYQPQVCIGGFHLFNPVTKKSAPPALLDNIAQELRHYSQTHFYTCHCTGHSAYTYLARELTNLSYLSCGDTLTL